MPEINTGKTPEELIRENERLRALVRSAWAILDRQVYEEVMSGGVNAIAGMGVASHAQKWMRKARI